MTSSLSFHHAQNSPTTIPFDLLTGDVTTDAFVCFFEQTGGVSWKTKTNWTTTPSICNWFGLACSGTDITINLNDNNLVGNLTKALECLSPVREFNVTQLSLAENFFSGTMPVFKEPLFVNIEKLEIYNRYGRKLTGSVPS